MDLQTIWIRIFPKLNNYNEFQKDELKTILFSELGNYVIEEKLCTDIVQYDDDTKGYTMFFVAKKVEGLSEKSLNYYKNVIDTFLGKFSKKLSQFTTDDIRYYLAVREMDDKVSPVTADNERRILSNFFAWLSNEEYISKNICAPIKQIRKPKRKKKAFSDVEITKIKDACQTYKNNVLEKKRAISIVEFLLSTGCRATELCSIKCTDIDLDARTAVVFGKGAKERNVYLNQVTKLRLQEYWKERNNNAEYAFCSTKFPFSKMSVNTLEKLVKEIGQNANVNNCHPHRFRRTTATKAIKKGMSLVDVQKMLGHESLDTTKIYLDLDDTNLKYQHEKFM